MRRGGLSLALALAACGASATVPVAPVTPPAPTAPRLPRLGAVTLAPLIDQRPPALRTSRGLQQDQRFELLMVGTGFAWLHGRRVEGQTLVAGDRLRFSGTSGGPTAVVAGYVASLVERAAGQAVRPGATVSLATPDRIAATLGVRDGVVVVAILDQLDVAALASVNTLRGGSSYETARTTTTATYRETAGAASLTSTTATFANARVRLLVLQVQGGQLIGHHVIYGRGAAGDLGAALDDLGGDLGRGLAALFADPPAPEPTPVPAPEPAPGIGTPPATAAPTTGTPTAPDAGAPPPTAPSPTEQP